MLRGMDIDHAGPEDLNGNRKTMLQVAVENGHVEMTAELLSADQFHEDTMSSAADTAALNGDVQVLKRIVAKTNADYTTCITSCMRRGK